MGTEVKGVHVGNAGLERWQTTHSLQYFSMSCNIPTQHPTWHTLAAVFTNPRCVAVIVLWCWYRRVGWYDSGIRGTNTVLRLGEGVYLRHTNSSCKHNCLFVRWKGCLRHIEAWGGTEWVWLSAACICWMMGWLSCCCLHSSVHSCTGVVAAVCVFLESASALPLSCPLQYVMVKSYSWLASAHLARDLPFSEQKATVRVHGRWWWKNVYPTSGGEIV